MAHMLKIAPVTGLGSLWMFGLGKQTGVAYPESPTPLDNRKCVVRLCPVCGHDTNQRVIEARPSYVTYWCTECSIPHDIERNGSKDVGLPVDATHPTGRSANKD